MSEESPTPEPRPRMSMHPLFWGLIATPVWGALMLATMTLLHALGVPWMALIEVLSIAAATVIVLRFDVALRPPGMPGIGWQRPTARVVLPALVAGLGVAILSSEVDNIVRDRVPLDVAPMTGEGLAAGPDWLVFLAHGLVLPFSVTFLCLGITMRNMLSVLSLRWAIALGAFAMVWWRHSHPAYWLPWTLAPLLGGWLYARTANIWVGAAAVWGQFAAAALGAVGALPPIQGLVASDAYARVAFQPLWFDLLGVALLALGLVLFSRAVEARATGSPST